MIEKKVANLHGFLKKKLVAGIDAESAPFVIDHFCEEMSFLFLMATQEGDQEEKPGQIFSYVIWRPQVIFNLLHKAYNMA